MFTRSRHWSLSWAISIQSTPSYPISVRFSLILFSHLRLGLPSGLFTSSFSTKILYTALIPHVCYMPYQSHLSWLDHPVLKLHNSLRVHARAISTVGVGLGDSCGLREASSLFLGCDTMYWCGTIPTFDSRLSSIRVECVLCHFP